MLSDLLPSFLTPTVLANGTFLLVYVLFLFEALPKVVIALLGAMLLILLGVISQAQAFSYIDLNVIFLLVGMMIIVNIIKETGAFHALGHICLRLAQGKPIVLLLLLCVLTAVCSALLDNVTTMLFMANITIALCVSLGLNPVPLLISEVIASNIGGTATLIGDPPNILIASAAHLSFNDFLIHILPVILLILPVALATLFLFYRKDLAQIDPEKVALALGQPAPALQDKPMFIKSVVVLTLVLLGFVFHHALQLEVGTIAMAGAAVLMLFEDPKSLWSAVEWDTIFFFIGLFIIVGALEHVGTLRIFAQQWFSFAQGDFKVLTLSLLWVSGLLSAVVDNIPYTATMIPVIKSVSLHFKDATPLWWALSLGACLGGNGTLIGATANVVVADIAAYQCGQRIRFWEFMKVGSVITLQSLLIASVYIYLRYLA